MTTTYTLTPTTLVNYPTAEGETDVVFRVVWNYSGADALRRQRLALPSF